MTADGWRHQLPRIIECRAVRTAVCGGHWDAPCLMVMGEVTGRTDCRISKPATTAMRALRRLQIGLPLNHGGGEESLQERTQNGRSSSEISVAPVARAAGLALSALSESAGCAPFPSREPRSTRSLATISARYFFSALCRSSELVVWSLPSIYRCAPCDTNSPTISASFRETTMLCHSLRSWNLPLLSLHRSLVARLNLPTGIPLAVYLTSGSFPTKPTRMTLFTFFIICHHKMALMPSNASISQRHFAVLGGLEKGVDAISYFSPGRSLRNVGLDFGPRDGV